MRVIFDRSAFHGDRFDTLVSSPLRQLVSQRRVVVYHTPIFLQETLEASASERASETWRAHLEFAVNICNGGFFIPKDAIFRSEFLGGDRRRLLPSKRTRNLPSLSNVLTKMREVAVSGDLAREWLESETEREDTYRKKYNQRALFSGARRDVMAARREGRLTGPLRDYSFAEFHRTEFARNGRQLTTLIDERRAGELADRWEAHPEKFPFYTAFVEGFLYSQYYAAVEHNQRIDGNAQADYEQLAYLTWADVIVSNDEQFFRSAFESIWKPRGKRMESAEGFSALLSRISS